MRHGADRRRARAIFRAILPGGHGVYFVRCGSHLFVSVGLHFPQSRLVRICGDDDLYRHTSGRVPVPLEKRRAGLARNERSGTEKLTETPKQENSAAGGRPSSVEILRAWDAKAV